MMDIEKTDEKRLFRFILRRSNSDEFFLFHDLKRETDIIKKLTSIGELSNLY